MRLGPNTSAVKDTPQCISADGSIRYAHHQSQISAVPLRQDKNHYAAVRPVELVRAHGPFQSMGRTLKRAIQSLSIVGVSFREGAPRRTGWLKVFTGLAKRASEPRLSTNALEGNFAAAEHPRRMSGTFIHHPLAQNARHWHGALQPIRTTT